REHKRQHHRRVTTGSEPADWRIRRVDTLRLSRRNAPRIRKENASEPSGGGDAEQREHHPGEASGSGANAEEAHRRRLGPEEQDRFVEKGPPDETRDDEISAFDHLLRDRGVETFVGIRQGRVEEKRRQIEKRRDRDENPEPQVPKPKSQ